jgi:chromosome segregation ATPase
MFSRILTLLAGAFISALVLRRNDSKPGEAPWRPELEDLHKKLQTHLDVRDAELAARIAGFQPDIRALAAELNATPDTSLDELAGRMAQLQSKIEAVATGLAKPDPRLEAIAVRMIAAEARTAAIEAKVGDLEQKAGTQDQRLQATSKVVVAIEQLVTSKIAEFDQRIESQGRSLQAINSSIAQSDELLERVLNLVQNISAPAETRAPLSTTPGINDVRELQL